MGKGISFILVGAIIALGSVFVVRQDIIVNPTVERVVEKVKNLGASAGPEHTERQYFQAGYTSGGDGCDFATSSTAATFTLTTKELGISDREHCYISWTVNVNTTLTTMASTSAPLIGLETGEEYSVLFYNASTTAGATATFAAGTGVDLQEDEGGSVIVNGLELARLTFVKKADTDVALIVEPYQVGD